MLTYIPPPTPKNLYAQYPTLPRCPVELWLSNEKPGFEVLLSGALHPQGDVCVEKRNRDIQYCVHVRHMLYLLGKVPVAPTLCYLK